MKIQQRANTGVHETVNSKPISTPTCRVHDGFQNKKSDITFEAEFLYACSTAFGIGIIMTSYSAAVGYLGSATKVSIYISAFFNTMSR